MKVAIGSDHGGYELKKIIVDQLRKDGRRIIDVGAKSYDSSDDYPDYAKAVGEAVRRKKAQRGIIICGSGVGASVAANKLNGIRAGLCHDTYSAHQGVEHDDMNVLCLGARVIGPELAIELIRTFLNAKFSGEKRRVRRLEKIKAIEDSTKGRT